MPARAAMHGLHSGHDASAALLPLHEEAHHPKWGGEAVIEFFSCRLIPPCWTWAELLLGLFFGFSRVFGNCLSDGPIVAALDQEGGIGRRSSQRDGAVIGSAGGLRLPCPREKVCLRGVEGLVVLQRLGQIG